MTLKLDAERTSLLGCIKLTNQQLDEISDFCCARNDHTDHFLEVESVLENEDVPEWLRELAEQAQGQNVYWILASN